MRLALGLCLGVMFATAPLRAQTPVVVLIENTMETDSFFFTPVWIAAHNGDFDVWSSGQPASNFPGLEEIAEEGNTAPISAAFLASSAGIAGGVDATVTATAVPAPVFSPGEAATFLLDVPDPATNRYFSYATMIIPSNDLFAAVSIPTTHEMFDANGDFLGPITIEVRGSDVVDAGTEVNDITGGAAFSALGGTATDEANLLADIYDLDPQGTYLQSIVDTDTVTGVTIGSTFAVDPVIFRITIKEVPKPRLAVQIENELPAGGLSLTPFWIAAQNGDFDVWSGGQLAANFPGLEELAEEGNTGPISAAFLASSAATVGGVDATVVANAQAPPVFSPGEIASFVLEVADPAVNRYFSYASMVIPSNDLFVAVSVPTTHELFDTQGNFLGPITIEIFGSDVVDAGTEVNNIAGGAAFSALGGTSIDESNLLADIFDLDPSGVFLNSILGTQTAPGDTVTSVFSATDLIATITIDRADAMFVRGDVTADGTINLSDPISILLTLFSQGAPFLCESAADVNDSNAVDLADAVLLLTYLFGGGFEPAAPFPACGLDTSPNTLRCDDFAACP